VRAHDVAVAANRQDRLEREGPAMTSNRNDTTWNAEPGDEVVVKGHHLGEPEQEGEILEVLGDAGGPPYEVRWDDGRVTRFYPGSDAFIRHLHHDTSSTTSARVDRTRKEM
jgi:Domain of unknown function (DUF1918)